MGLLYGATQLKKDAVNLLKVILSNFKYFILASFLGVVLGVWLISKKSHTYYTQSYSANYTSKFLWNQSQINFPTYVANLNQELRHRESSLQISSIRGVGENKLVIDINSGSDNRDHAKILHDSLLAIYSKSEQSINENLGSLNEIYKRYLSTGSEIDALKARSILRITEDMILNNNLTTKVLPSVTSVEISSKTKVESISKKKKIEILLFSFIAGNVTCFLVVSFMASMRD